MADWIQRVRAIIRKNLEGSPFTDEQKEAIVDDFIAEMENPPVEETAKSAEEDEDDPPATPRKLKPNSLDVQREEILAKQKAEDDPLTSKGEKLSDPRARAHKEWEPWNA
jgi:hypothetical protein